MMDEYPYPWVRCPLCHSKVRTEPIYLRHGRYLNNTMRTVDHFCRVEDHCWQKCPGVMVAVVLKKDGTYHAPRNDKKGDQDLR